MVRIVMFFFFVRWRVACLARDGEYTAATLRSGRAGKGHVERRSEGRWLADQETRGSGTIRVHAVPMRVLGVLGEWGGRGANYSKRMCDSPPE